MKRVFGIDVGGMSVKFAIVDETGTIIERWSIPTNLAEMCIRDSPCIALYALKKRVSL